MLWDSNINLVKYEKHDREDGFLTLKGKHKKIEKEKKMRKTKERRRFQN
jgi:hypothetical protein